MKIPDSIGFLKKNSLGTLTFSPAKSPTTILNSELLLTRKKQQKNNLLEIYTQSPQMIVV